jgi:hypothetical protein
MSSSICLPRTDSCRASVGRPPEPFRSSSVRPSDCRSGPGPGCAGQSGLALGAAGGRLHYPRHRGVPLTRSLHTRSESSGPGAGPLAGRRLWPPARSRIQVRVRPGDSAPPVHHHDPPAAHPSRPSVRPSDSLSRVCPGQPAGPGSARPCAPSRCARAIRVGSVSIRAR